MAQSPHVSASVPDEAFEIAKGGDVLRGNAGEGRFGVYRHRGQHQGRRRDNHADLTEQSHGRPAGLGLLLPLGRELGPLFIVDRPRKVGRSITKAKEAGMAAVIAQTALKQLQNLKNSSVAPRRHRTKDNCGGRFNLGISDS